MRNLEIASSNLGWGIFLYSFPLKNVVKIVQDDSSYADCTLVQFHRKFFSKSVFQTLHVNEFFLSWIVGLCQIKGSICTTLRLILHQSGFTSSWILWFFWKNPKFSFTIIMYILHLKNILNIVAMSIVQICYV